MAYRIIILRSAAEDAQQAYKYYEELSAGLGDRFLAEVLERYNEVSKHPHYYGFIDDQNIIRDVKLKNFPYLVLYEIDGKSVIIYSLHNMHKHPDKRFRK
jgi:predicted glycosyltransferase